MLSYFGNYTFFTQNSRIEHIAEGKPVSLQKEHYIQIRNKVYNMNL